MLHRMDVAKIIGLSFRPDKCATLSLTLMQQQAKFVQIEDLTIQGNHLPSLVARGIISLSWSAH